MIPWWVYVYLAVGGLVAYAADNVANTTATPYWFKYRTLAWLICIVLWLPILVVILSGG